MLMKDASILIVDDDPDVLTAVRLLLKTEVKQVVTEKSPENLKYLLSQQPFDLILLRVLLVDGLLVQHRVGGAPVELTE